MTQDKIVLPATQSSITAIASDYASIAGGHPTIGVFDEIWAATSERARRLWDELVPVPTRTGLLDHFPIDRLPRLPAAYRCL